MGELSTYQQTMVIAGVKKNNLRPRRKVYFQERVLREFIEISRDTFFEV